jgi:hypothetical protein
MDSSGRNPTVNAVGNDTRADANGSCDGRLIQTFFQDLCLDIFRFHVGYHAGLHFHFFESPVLGCFIDCINDIIRFVKLFFRFPIDFPVNIYMSLINLHKHTIFLFPNTTSLLGQE